MRRAGFGGISCGGWISAALRLVRTANYLLLRRVCLAVAGPSGGWANAETRRFVVWLVSDQQRYSDWVIEAALAVRTAQESGGFFGRPGLDWPSLSECARAELTDQLEAAYADEMETEWGRWVSWKQVACWIMSHRRHPDEPVDWGRIPNL